MASAIEGEKLFEDVCSEDFLGFSFDGRSYSAQLTEAIQKTQVRGGRDPLSSRTRHRAESRLSASCCCTAWECIWYPIGSEGGDF
jgi:hypothetical protein